MFAIEYVVKKLAMERNIENFVQNQISLILKQVYLTMKLGHGSMAIHMVKVYLSRQV